jgi:transposase
LKNQQQKGGIAVRNISTKKLRKVNDKTLLVTVDIGQVKNMGYWRCPDGTDIEPFEFFNNGRGFNKFRHNVYKALRTNELEEMVVGFESTGAYGEPLLHYLRKRSIKLVQVNPMHTKRLKELHDNSPNKTDKKDPKVIADIIEYGHALTHVVPKGAAADLRRLTQARERSMKRRTALLNQLHDLAFILFPEFVQVMKGVKTKSARYILKHYPTPQDIISHGLEDLSITLKKVSRGRLDKARAEALYEGACQSAGISEGKESIILEIQQILAAIESTERFTGEVEKRIAQSLKLIPYSEYILSLKGIAEVTAAGIIGEVGDFTMFDTVAEVTKLAGLDLFEISSGKHKGKRRISKRGRPLLRKILYYAALNVVRKGGALQETYRCYTQRGMVKTKALIAVARKLLRIIFALVRNHNVFVKNYIHTQTLKEAA